MPRPRITVLISGSGTNLQALIAALSSTLSPAIIVRVLSNRKNAYGLTRASDAGIPTAYHNLLAKKKAYMAQGLSEQQAREDYDSELAELVLRDSPDLVVCAGFMHIVSPRFLKPLEEKGVDIINLHPALWGQFDGAAAIERAHAAFMEGKIQKTGVMIHYVIAEVDRGALVVDEEVPLEHPRDDELETLTDRIHGVEHQLIVKGTRIALDEIARRKGVSWSMEDQ